MIYSRIMKRIIDFLIAFLGLLILSPFLLFISFVLLISTNGSPFFVQDRPGKNGRIFRFIKFKTMSDLKDENGKLLPDKQRLTPAGHFIRSTSLDELPQLINVIKGDMSLVGPRPLLVRYLQCYNHKQARRHELRPGITGWAQIGGRNAISWEQKFELDVWYVDNISFMLDMKILLITIKKVIMRHGINAGVGVTMGEFLGKGVSRE
jgi:undecaprenyl phosphate N,N'-diacetylbacillosamine 1-phosphate transferase